MSETASDALYNILRVTLFAFICGVVFTLLAIMGSYSVPDTGLRHAIMEERIMNQITNSRIQTISEIDTDFIANAITSSPERRKNDNFAIRLRFFDLLTKEQIKINPQGTDQTITYDVNIHGGLTQDSKFIMFYPLTGRMKSNYESRITKRLWTEPSTKRSIVIQFEYVAKRN